MRWLLLLATCTAAMAQVPVVVELFTSEGCSSCPPADEVLAKIDGQELAPGVEIVALGEHVDYWDRLGWRDRFSSAAFSARQEEYGRQFHLGGIYTPQVVVQGQAECLGSDLGAIRKAARAAALQPHAKVDVAKTDRGIRVTAGPLPQGIHSADVLLAITESGLATHVGNGENQGRTLQHAGVVRSLTQIGRIDGTTYAAEMPVKLNSEWNAANVKLVVLVQDRMSRRILGVGTIRQ